MRMATLLLVLALLPFQGARQPVPNPDAQKDAEKLVREVFKEDLARKAPADRSALAKKLLAQGIRTEDDAPSRYVLLREAREIARDAGDWTTALQAIDDLGRFFEADVATPRWTVYLAMGKAAKTPEEWAGLARRHLALADEAAAADQIDVAVKAVAEASALARKAKDIPLTGKAEAKNREIADRKSWRDKVVRATELLAKNPADPESNLIVGRHEGFLRGNWEKAIPLLAKGSDPAIKAAATRELSKPATSDDQVAAGDGWWDLADKETIAAVQTNLRRRALHWYQQASPTGLVKLKVDKRMSEVRGDQFPGTWVEMQDPGLFGLPGKPGDPITLDGTEGQGARVVLQTPFKVEYDGIMARLRLQKAPEGLGAIWFEAIDRGLNVSRGYGSASLMYVAEGGKLKTVKPIEVPDKEDYAVTLILSGNEYVYYVDGREINRMSTKYTKITHMAFQVEKGIVTFDQLRLRRKE